MLFFETLLSKFNASLAFFFSFLDLIASFGRRQKRVSSSSSSSQLNVGAAGNDINSHSATSTPIMAHHLTASRVGVEVTSRVGVEVVPRVGEEEPPSPFASPTYKWQKTPRLTESEAEEMDEKGWC